MNNIQIEKILREKYGYNELGIKEVLKEISQIDPEIGQKLEKFLETGEIQEMEIEGYTIDKLMKEHGFNAVAAYLTMDWLRKSPKEAIASLKRGHDSVV